MTLRNTSGKFSLPSFVRKASGAIENTPHSPARTNGYADDEGSPGGGGGFGGGLGKLGKSIAHQSLLPALGNQDMRLLQDVIATEKSVLQATDKLATDTSKSAATLPPYGAQEGPDLQDVLTHSSTLLQQLSSALHVFTDHQMTMRSAYKRIRHREEELDELRRRRRSTGAKSEAAEKKLAKMGPENKGLPAQTELLERLRQDMRQMDTDIITEEAKIGDFKRQVVKEALSLKFGGLEELGEKMCIIGELGKLLLEEIPLEETPPGYGRAPYTGYDKTENAVNEAVKCLATVQFHAASANPKPPSLPHPVPGQPQPFRRAEPNVSAAEEYANYPDNAASPQTHSGKGRDYGLDDSPYGGIGMGNPYASETPKNLYDDYGGSRSGNEVVWQGPTEEAMARRERETSHGPDYEYEQQQQMDRERREEEEAEQAWREPQVVQGGAAGSGGAPVLNVPVTSEEGAGTRPWEPLNVKRGTTPVPQEIFGGPLSATEGAGRSSLENTHPPTRTSLEAPHAAYGDLQPPRPISTPGIDDFHTPMATPELLPSQDDDDVEHFPTTSSSNPTAPAPPPPPAPAPIEGLPEPAPPPPPPMAAPTSPTSQNFSSVPVGGKISAAAFRRAAKPRTSLDPESPEGSEVGRMSRRLPVPPVGGAERERSTSPAISPMGEKRENGGAQGGFGGGGVETKRPDVGEGEMPPGYREDSKEDSLR